MKHRKASIKLNRTSSHRDAMFRNMVTSLFKYERIRTTDVKAKELSRWADHLITLAKKGDLHSRRQVLSIVREKKVVHKLFEEASERYGQRPGGHTRIVKIGHRPGDAARISLIELTGKARIDEKKTKKKKTEAVKKADSIETEEKPAKTDKEAKALPKTKKTVEAKKKITSKKKDESKKTETEKKDKKTSVKKDKKTSSELKQDKTTGEKKSVRPKKKAAPKDKKEK